MNTLVITKTKTRNCVCQLELTGLVYYVLFLNKLRSGRGIS